MTTSATPGQLRTRARRGDGGKLREEILSAATELLVATGDEAAVSVRAVAKQVGVTPPSIYLHFADKNELLFECCSLLLGRLRETVLRKAGDLEDPFDRLRVAAHQFVRFGIDNPEPYRIMFMSPHHDVPADFDADAYEGLLAFRALGDLVGQALGDDAATGDPRDPSSTVSMHSMGLLAAIHGVVSLMVAKAVEPIDFPWPDVAPLVDHVMDVHLAAIRADAQRTDPR